MRVLHLIKTAVGAIIGEDSVLGTPEGKTIGKIITIAGRKTISASAENIKKYPDLYKSIEEKNLMKQGEDYKKMSFSPFSISMSFTPSCSILFRLFIYINLSFQLFLRKYNLVS